MCVSMTMKHMHCQLERHGSDVTCIPGWQQKLAPRPVVLHYPLLIRKPEHLLGPLESKASCPERESKTRLWNGQKSLQGIRCPIGQAPESAIGFTLPALQQSSTQAFSRSGYTGSGTDVCLRHGCSMMFPGSSKQQHITAFCLSKIFELEKSGK